MLTATEMARRLATHAADSDAGKEPTPEITPANDASSTDDAEAGSKTDPLDRILEHSKSRISGVESMVSEGIVQVREHSVEYNLQRPLDKPLGGGKDKYAKVTKISFPLQLYGRHLKYAMTPQEGLTHEVTYDWLKNFSGMDEAFLDRLNGDDFVGAGWVADHVYSGKFKSSVGIEKP